MRMSRRTAIFSAFKNSKINGPVWSNTISVPTYANDMYIGPPVGKYGMLMKDTRGANTGLAGSTVLYAIDDDGVITTVGTTSGGHDGANTFSFGEHTGDPEYNFFAGARDQSYHFNTSYASVNKSLTLSSGSSFPVSVVDDYSLAHAGGHLPSYIYLTMYRWNSSEKRAYYNLAAWNKSLTVHTVTDYAPGNWNAVSIPDVGSVYVYVYSNGADGRFIDDSLTLTLFTPVCPVHSWRYDTISPFRHTKTKGVLLAYGRSPTYTVTYYTIDKTLTINSVGITIEAYPSSDGPGTAMCFKGKLLIAPYIYSNGDNTSIPVYQWYATIDDSGSYEIIGETLDTTYVGDPVFMTRSANKLYAGDGFVSYQSHYTSDPQTKYQIFS